MQIIGKKFNRITIVSYHSTSIHKKKRYNCLCECGKEFIAIGSSVKNGNSKSCGCLNDEKRKAKGRNLKHGQRIKGNTTKLYTTWSGLKSRCNDLSDKNYGGRGISYCSEWEIFENFAEWANKNGYSKNLSLDRIDNDGNYEPSNCRWATLIEQANNKKTNKPITHNGITMNINQWATHLGINKQTLKSRIGKYNMSLDMALRNKIYKRGRLHTL